MHSHHPTLDKAPPHTLTHSGTCSLSAPSSGWKLSFIQISCSHSHSCSATTAHSREHGERRLARYVMVTAVRPHQRAEQSPHTHTQTFPHVLSLTNTCSSVYKHGVLPQTSAVRNIHGAACFLRMAAAGGGVISVRDGHEGTVSFLFHSCSCFIRILSLLEGKFLFPSAQSVLVQSRRISKGKCDLERNFD